MNLQPLYDVKERLEYAAVAGVSLLGEDFRLQRAAEALKPLAAASPVFGKIDAGLVKLLSAPAQQRPGLLLDVLALVDAVAYTQAKTGAEGELEPLPTGGGRYYQISYGQIQPLLTALTTTGGGRVEVVKSTWERCPDWFRDYRVLPALVGGLGDSYGEMADLCAKYLKKLGPSVIPQLKKGFDPAGKREMVRRVEVIAAVDEVNAAPWLREVLPEAKKDVRAAVISALGVDSGDAALLLKLAGSERGKNRDATLEALAKQDGDEVRDFWEAELAKDKASVRFLNTARSDWASDLVARGLWDRLEAMVDQGGRVDQAAQDELGQWYAAAIGKSSPSMLDFWRWADGRMADIQRLEDAVGKPLRLNFQAARRLWDSSPRDLCFAEQLEDLLLDSLCAVGPGPLCGLCLELWEKHRKETRWLPHAVVASLLTRSASEVYDEFSPYVPTIKPLLEGAEKQKLHNAVLRGLSRLKWGEDGTYRVSGVWPAAQPLDPRWIERLIRSAWKTAEDTLQESMSFGDNIEEFDGTLMDLADRKDAQARKPLVPYFQRRMAETGHVVTYGMWLLRLGVSPRAGLKAGIKTRGTAPLVFLWKLMEEAARTLPVEETAALLQEVLEADRCMPGDNLQWTIPYTIQRLRAGDPFPDWSALCQAERRLCP